MNQGQGFGESGVEAEGGGDGAGNLRDFDGVRQTIAKMIGKSRGENLGLGFQAAESSRVHDAIAITDVLAAVRMRRLRVAASARIFFVHGPGSWRVGWVFDEAFGRAGHAICPLRGGQKSESCALKL